MSRQAQPGQLVTKLNIAHRAAVKSGLPHLLKVSVDPEALGKFWLKVNKRGPTRDHFDSRCWEWVGCKSADGYGRFYYKGRDWRAHRLSFLLATGKEPEVVMHRCNNPACVRPSHLQAGDSKENLLDILIDRIYQERDVV